MIWSCIISKHISLKAFALLREYTFIMRLHNWPIINNSKQYLYCNFNT